MTSGKSVYPMMETDWKKALCTVSISSLLSRPDHAHVAAQQLDLHRHDCLAYPDHGEDTREDEVLLLAARTPREEQAQQQAEDERAPQIPVSQSVAHAALEECICVWPSSCNVPKTPTEAVSFAALCCADATALLHHAAEQVLGVQHLLHLLPYGEQVARERLPYRLVDSVGGRAAVLARNARRQVRLRVGSTRPRRNVSRERRAVRRALQRIV